MYRSTLKTYTISDSSTLIGGGEVQYNSIGTNIRKFRTEKKLRQEDLAERAGLSANYIGMVERGEKIPSLESFISIVNALGVSADMVLHDVLETGYEVKSSLLNDKLRNLSKHDREKIFAVIETMILSADLSIAADILAQREMVEVEGQIDEILLGGVFQLGDADEELIVFVIVEALHPLCEVVQLVQIGEAVFQHGEFFRPVDLCHEG